MKVRMFDGSVQKLSEVIHAPNLKNSISLGTLGDNKGIYSGGNDMMKVKKFVMVIMKAHRFRKLCKLPGETITHKHEGFKLYNLIITKVEN